MNIRKLKAAMVERGINTAQLADRIGVNRSTLYRRIATQGRGFTIGEAESIAAVLDLSPAESTAIFLETMSHKRDYSNTFCVAGSIHEQKSPLAAGRKESQMNEIKITPEGAVLLNGTEVKWCLGLDINSIDPANGMEVALRIAVDKLDANYKIKV